MLFLRLKYEWSVLCTLVCVCVCDDSKLHSLSIHTTDTHTHRRKTRSEYVYILATEALVLSFNIQRCCCCRRLSMLPLVPPYVITPQTHTQHFQLRPHISISSAMCFVNQRFLLLLSAAVAAISTRKSDACTLATEVKKKRRKTKQRKNQIRHNTHTHTFRHIRHPAKQPCRFECASRRSPLCGVR